MESNSSLQISFVIKDLFWDLIKIVISSKLIARLKLTLFVKPVKMDSS